MLLVYSCSEDDQINPIDEITNDSMDNSASATIDGTKISFNGGEATIDLNSSNQELYLELSNNDGLGFRGWEISFYAKTDETIETGTYLPVQWLLTSPFEDYCNFDQSTCVFLHYTFIDVLGSSSGSYVPLQDDFEFILSKIDHHFGGRVVGSFSGTLIGPSEDSLVVENGTFDFEIADIY